MSTLFSTLAYQAKEKGSKNQGDRAGIRVSFPAPSFPLCITGLRAYLAVAPEGFTRRLSLHVSVDVHDGSLRAGP